MLLCAEDVCVQLLSHTRKRLLYIPGLVVAACWALPRGTYYSIITAMFDACVFVHGSSMQSWPCYCLHRPREVRHTNVTRRCFAICIHRPQDSCWAVLAPDVDSQQESIMIVCAGRTCLLVSDLQVLCFVLHVLPLHTCWTVGLVVAFTSNPTPQHTAIASSTTIRLLRREALKRFLVFTALIWQNLCHPHAGLLRLLVFCWHSCLPAEGTTVSATRFCIALHGSSGALQLSTPNVVGWFSSVSGSCMHCVATAQRMSGLLLHASSSADCWHLARPDTCEQDWV